MKIRKRIFTILTAAVLLSSGIDLTAIAAKPQTVEAVTDMTAAENFSKIRGHDANHPIWRHRSLGVIVRTDDPTFLADVSEACAAWAPVFTFYDYGYVQPGVKVDTHHGKYHFVYITKKDLSADRERDNNDVAGETWGLNPPKVNRQGFFTTPSVKIIVDPDFTISNFSQYGDPHQEAVSVIEHELGHALGLRHSTNHADLMYAGNLDNPIQPEELAAVRRMYRGVSPLAYPNELPTVKPSVTITTYSDSDGGSDSDSTGTHTESYTFPSQVINRFYLKKKNADKLTDAIDDHLCVINSNRKSLRYRCYFNYRVTKAGRNYNRRYLPNGTYRVRYSGVRFTQLRPHASWQHDRYVFGASETEVGDYLPKRQQLHYCHGFYIRPYSHKSTRRLSFDLYVRIHDHHFSVVR